MEFNFYNINSNYCDYLRNYDKNIPYTMDNKATRPFIGIVIKIEDINYYAPLTSPKEKHLKMKNQIDFLKIDNGNLGAINFNNMIPVTEDNISKIEIKNIQDKDYKNLLENQLSWCNKKQNKQNILDKAKKLYDYINNPNNIKNVDRWEKIKSRCCDFKKLEQLSKVYSNNIQQDIKNKPKLSLKDKLNKNKKLIEDSKNITKNIKSNNRSL